MNDGITLAQLLGLGVGFGTPIVLAVLAALAFVFRGGRVRTRPMDPRPQAAAHAVERVQSERAHAEHAVGIDALEARAELDPDEQARLDAAARRFR